MAESIRLQLRNRVRAPLPRGLLLRVARRVLAQEGLTGPLIVAVHLLDEPDLQRANREHRGIDAPTDVLSFPLLEDPRSEPAFVLPPGEPRHLGDILISYPRAARQAEEYGHNVEREVCYLLAHGLLHLLGYDHVEEQERLAMREREEAALQPLGLTR